MTNKATKAYFKQLIKEQASNDRQKLKQILYDLFECKKNVCHSLRFGDLQINEQPIPINKEKDLEADLKLKKLMFQKEIQSLDRDLFQSEQAYKNAKLQLKMKRDQEIKAYKEQEQKKNRQISQKVKKWSQELKGYDKKRQSNFEKVQQRLKNQEQIAKRMQEQQMHIGKIQKQKIIAVKLRQLEEKKERRKEQFIRSVNKSVDKLPLFQELQKKHKQLEYEKKFEQNLARKNHKIMTKFDHESIKVHEKQFLTRLNDRNRRMEQSKYRAQSSEDISEFNLFTNRNQEKLIEDIEKRKRRIKFQEKVKKIPIEIDEAKRVKIEIERDKAKNPFKYNFLSQKSLNQFQIYGEFKDFAMNVDAKEIGKGYFEEMKKKVNESRVGLGKSSSLNIIKEAQTQKIPYRNYLDDLKMKRKLADEDKPSADEIDKIIKSHKNKERALIQLQKKSQFLENQALQKKKKIKSTSGFKETVQKQEQMDNAYMKSLKAKLAYIQMNT